MKERHLWTRRAFRTQWGVVPCQCAPARREHTLFSEWIPTRVAQFLRCFLMDCDEA